VWLDSFLRKARNRGEAEARHKGGIEALWKFMSFSFSLIYGSDNKSFFRGFSA
jgi:hypothetical protein